MTLMSPLAKRMPHQHHSKSHHSSHQQPPLRQFQTFKRSLQTMRTCKLPPRRIDTSSTNLWKRVFPRWRQRTSPALWWIRTSRLISGRTQARTGHRLISSRWWRDSTTASITCSGSPRSPLATTPAHSNPSSRWSRTAISRESSNSSDSRLSNLMRYLMLSKEIARSRHSI